MRGRVAAVVVGVAVLSSATVGTAAVLRTGSGTAEAAIAGPAAGTHDYYDTARASLSPLIQHVRDLPTALTALAGPQSAPSKSLRTRALQWAEDCANARDLVGRVPAPQGAAGAHIVTLYQSAAMLYTEAARMAAEAAGSRRADERRADAVLGEHLYSIADRMFDGAYRLLNSGGALTSSELHFPGAVPDFSLSDTGTVAPQVEAPAGMPIAAWRHAHGRDVQVLASAVASGLAASPTATRVELTQDQSRLADVVVSEQGQEAVSGLRLAALVLGEGLAREGSAGAGDLTARRLALIAQRVWVSSAALVPDAVLRGSSSTVSPAADESALFTGGFFAGNPPALKPGDGPGAGLPGGLPTLDAQQLLGK